MVSRRFSLAWRQVTDAELDSLLFDLDEGAIDRGIEAARPQFEALVASAGSHDDSKYSADHELTNFREICMGTISRGLLYRGSYPIHETDHEKNKAYNKLVADANISCVLNLADNEFGLEKIAGLVPWYRKLLRENKVIGLGLRFTCNFDFENKKQNQLLKSKLKQGFQFLIKHDGPYLIHCHAGIDRTGFVAAILGALFGANADEIVHDYLLSYGKKYADRNFSIFNERQIILNQLGAITNGEIDDDDLQSNIEKYFLEEIGLTTAELDMLKDRLSK